MGTGTQQPREKRSDEPTWTPRRSHQNQRAATRRTWRTEAENPHPVNKFDKEQISRSPGTVKELVVVPALLDLFRTLHWHFKSYTLIVPFTWRRLLRCDFRPIGWTANAYMLRRRRSPAKSRRNVVRKDQSLHWRSLYNWVVRLKILLRENLFYVNTEYVDQITPSNSPRACGTK